MKVRILGALLLLLGAVAVVTAPPAGAAALLTVTPAADLVDRQEVRVDAVGFTPFELIGACQTVPGADDQSDCATGTLATATASEAGSVSVVVAVRRFAYIPSLERTIDCADPAESCVIGAAEAFDIAATSVVHPISFAPPPPPPTERGAISVSPDDGLVNGDVVTVEGHGFRPEVDIVVGQCADRPATPNDCQQGEDALVRTDVAGSFSTTLAVHRLFYLPGASALTDCASTRCTVAASELLDFPGTVVVAPVAFEPRLGEPAISVAPDSGLRPGDEVLVSGTGFEPNEVVNAWQCGSAGGCGPNASTVAGVDGTFGVTLTMYDPGDDCRAATASCHVIVQQWSPSTISLTAPIAFAPLAPPPPVVLPGGATVVEGDGPTIELLVPVTLSAPSAQVVSVEWATVHDPTWSALAATPGSDYVPASGVVTFPPGSTEGFATVEVVGDDVPEPGELLVVSFRNPTNARMGGFWGLGFGGVADDD